MQSTWQLVSPGCMVAFSLVLTTTLSISKVRSRDSCWWGPAEGFASWDPRCPIIHVLHCLLHSPETFSDGKGHPCERCRLLRWEWEVWVEAPCPLPSDWWLGCTSRGEGPRWEWERPPGKLALNYPRMHEAAQCCV